MVEHTIDWKVDVAQTLGVILLFVLVILGKSVYDKTDTLTAKVDALEQTNINLTHDIIGIKNAQGIATVIGADGKQVYYYPLIVNTSIKG